MTKLLTRLGPAAGAAGGDNLYVEDVFSTYLYDTAHGTSPIVNGINLADEGGLVWFKHRTSTYSNILFDTERGTSNHLVSNTTAANATSIGLGSFNTDGFSFSGVNLNVNSASHVAWTFRKAAGFFDVVTYTGNGTAGRTVAHSLGSVPKMMIVKNTTTARSWAVYHSGLGGTKDLALDDTASAYTRIAVWNDTNPTSSVFTVGSGFLTNTNGDTYVAYLFGDDAVFGEDGDERICQMSRYLGTGSNGNTINVGFEPQWVLFKPDTGSGDWQIVDSMRGWTADGVASRLEANTSDAEAQSGSSFCNLTSTGFVQNGSSGSNNASGIAYLYMAIRRPMKVPEAGTEVFAIDTAGSVDSNKPQYRSGFPVDMVLERPNVSGSENMQSGSRLTQGKFLRTNLTNAEASFPLYQFDYMNGYYNSNTTITSYYAWMFKRASQFMDVVAYTGNNSVRTISHNLQAVPELMIVKCRSATGYWVVYDKFNTATDYMYLDSTNAAAAFSGYWNNTAPTSTVFTLGTGNGNDTNASGQSYIAYLFATLDGISKVGSYTGTGSNLNVDCSFSNGARFILIKRTDATGDWYVWDSVRGITAGNDPYLLLNTTAAQVTNTDYIDPLSSGFTVTSSAPAGLNASGGTYIFLAIA